MGLRYVKAALGALLVMLSAWTARADVIVERPAPTLMLSTVEVVRSDAPDAEARAVGDAVRRRLRQGSRRLASCLANVDLREDPVRGRRSRHVTIELRFDRSARPEVRLVRAHALPEAAQRCVMELARSVAAPAPRGTVVVRSSYVAR